MSIGTTFPIHLQRAVFLYLNFKAYPSYKEEKNLSNDIRMEHNSIRAKEPEVYNICSLFQSAISHNSQINVHGANNYGT